VFNETIARLQEFRYSRYIALLYYMGSQELTEFERQQQRNVGGFMKVILIKRLESSFYAFRRSVRRFIESYEKFIAMFDRGNIYISKNVDVFEYLEKDDLSALEVLVDEDKAQKYAAEDFRKDFRDDLIHDLELLRDIETLWQPVHEDPKLEAFADALKVDPALKDRRLIIFTESKETGEYLFETVNRQYPNQVLFFSSVGGMVGNPPVTHSPHIAREIIQSAFDPNHKEPRNDPRILITTDILSEGINLHRGNVLINYDLPWNPTRLLQRAGRVNRLGTEHPDIFIYNFFPTSQSDSHLGLEANITNKIQLFHDILGEDARYLTDGEEFGSRELFDTLNRKESYTGEDEEGDSELKYLDMMRSLRDENPELFEKIKRLPKKARSGRRVDGLASEQLVTFFRIGALKKFYQSTDGESAEITFFDAVKLLECEPDASRAEIPKDYFHWLEINRQRFKQDTIQDEEKVTAPGGRSNLSYIEKRLKDKAFRHCPKLTDADEAFLESLRRMIAQGLVAKKPAQMVKKALEKTLDPLEILGILRTHIRVVDTSGSGSDHSHACRREVILSGYRLASGESQ
jgi:superfamily II DNA/RNA helicase